VDRATAFELHELHARICKAIADPKRLLIINELRDGPLSVGEISSALAISQSNASQHLAVLRDRGIVQAEKAGTSVSYSLRSDKVVAAVDLLREFMAEELGSASKLGRAASQAPPPLARR
jgi:ArsR family transcriptional regulator